MPSKLRLVRCVPSPANYKMLLHQFSNRGGFVTATNDRQLRGLKEMMPFGPYCELLTFGEVVGRAMALAKLPSMALAQKGHMLAATEAACAELAEESMFYQSRRHVGFWKVIDQAIDRLHSLGLEPAEWPRLGDSDPLVRAKLIELAGIDEGIRQRTEALRRFRNSDRMRTCIDARHESKVELERILIFTGSELDPIAFQWLEWASQYSPGIELVLDSHAVLPNFFRTAVSIEEWAGSESEQVGQKQALSQAIFSGQIAESEDPRPSLMSAADPLAECEWVLRRCLEKAEAGTPFEEMAICCRRLDSYAPILSSAARRLGVPLRLAHRVPLMSIGLARLIRLFVELAAASDVRKLIPLIGNTYLFTRDEDPDELAEIIRAAHKSEGDTWASVAAAIKMAEKWPWLADFLAWREIARQDPAPLATWFARIEALAGIEPVLQAIDLSSPTCGPDHMALTAIQRVLSQYASIALRGGRPMGSKEFASFFGRLCDHADCGLPPMERGVAVISSAIELAEVQTLFVLGMLEGVFPRRRSEDPILTDRDVAAINLELGSGQLADSRDQARSEREEFYRLCVAPSQELVMSYPLADEDSDSIPAFYLSEVERAVGKLPVHEHPRSVIVPGADLCIASSDRALAQALAVPSKSTLAPDIETNLAKSIVVRKKGESITPSDLRDWYECPFRASFKRLGLRSNRFESRWSSLRRLPGAAKLAEASDLDAARRAMERSLEDLLDEHRGSIADHELSILFSGGHRLIGEWIDREAIARTCWPRVTTSIKSHVGFGEADLPARFELKGEVFNFAGKVDAISDIGPYKVAHITMSANIDKDSNELKWVDSATLCELGPYFLSLRKSSARVGLDVESIAGARYLLLLPGSKEGGFRSNVKAKVYAKEVGASKETYDQIFEALVFAANRAASGSIRPNPGDYCKWCDYGDLCRSSQEFGDNMAEGEAEEPEE